MRNHRPVSLDLKQTRNEIRATDIPWPPRAQQPQENHCWDDRNLPREELRRAPGESHSRHSAEAPGSCSDKPTGPASSRLRQSRSSHGPRDPRPRDTSLRNRGLIAASSHRE
ncbi:hypothetical protein ILYODFUR_030772 [Ilyodon furcidens]|uniref:Uncharacterized protein n=1 Tax=Ilyodon furcidens TaxID=33524 RepID=A0ABV0T1N3_9TELE